MFTPRKWANSPFPCQKPVIQHWKAHHCLYPCFGAKSQNLSSFLASCCRPPPRPPPPRERCVPPALLQPHPPGRSRHVRGASGTQSPASARAPALATFPSSCFTGRLAVPAELLPWQSLPSAASQHRAQSGSRASSLSGLVPSLLLLPRPPLLPGSLGSPALLPSTPRCRSPSWRWPALPFGRCVSGLTLTARQSTRDRAGRHRGVAFSSPRARTNPRTSKALGTL